MKQGPGAFEKKKLGHNFGATFPLNLLIAFIQPKVLS
jgi:hypothetical protein